MTSYKHPHFRKMVRVWNLTKSLFFCLRYDPLIVFWWQNHITLIFIKMMSHDLFVQMAYSQYLMTWGVDSPEWNGYTLHLLRILTYLTIHVCSQRKKRQNFWCKKKEVFTALQKIIANLTNRYCPRPRGKMQCYKSVIPWLCPGYSLAMSRDLGAVVSIDWCIWLLDTPIPRKWAFLQIALQCIANPLRMLCMSV